MLRGVHTGLRAITRADLETLRTWRNQPHLRRFFREHREISPEMQERWFETEIIKAERSRMFAIERLADGALLGAAGLVWIDWINRNADFSIYLGAEDLYIDEVCAPDAGRLLLAYGFEELALHRIWAEIYDIDVAKQSFLPRLGFVNEGRHRETHFTEGRWVDSLFYGLLATEFSSTLS
jgi:RimJ/RimL family protein N-acetyltransferase